MRVQRMLNVVQEALHAIHAHINILKLFLFTAIQHICIPVHGKYNRVIEEAAVT